MMFHCNAVVALLVATSYTSSAQDTAGVRGMNRNWRKLGFASTGPLDDFIEEFCGGSISVRTTNGKKGSSAPDYVEFILVAYDDIFDVEEVKDGGRRLPAPDVDEGFLTSSLFDVCDSFNLIGDISVSIFDIWFVVNRDEDVYVKGEDVANSTTANSNNNARRNNRNLFIGSPAYPVAYNGWLSLDAGVAANYPVQLSFSGYQSFGTVDYAARVREFCGSKLTIPELPTDSLDVGCPDEDDEGCFERFEFEGNPFPYWLDGFLGYPEAFILKLGEFDGDPVFYLILAQESDLSLVNPVVANYIAALDSNGESCTDSANGGNGGKKGNGGNGKQKKKYKKRF